MENNFREGSGEATKERGGNTLIVITYQAKPDAKLEKFFSEFRRGYKIQYKGGADLPPTPPGGLTEVFLDSGHGPRFYGAKHQKNWESVDFMQLVHSRDGKDIYLGQQRKKARDFEAYPE